MKLLAFSIILLSLLLAGCASAPAATTSPFTTATASPFRVEAVNSPAPSPTANPNVSATPDLRLPPERWQEWPIVPQVSARAREMYQRGLALGNDPHAFSKIGDCQSVPASFLGIYDTNRYSFAPEYQTLQDTVDYYAGSFNREGESVRGGFNTSSVLLPFWANTEVCQPGENPMQCENRIHNPSIVFISLEVWFEGRTPDIYEKYLRQIIEYNIEQGTLPILATKADNVEGDYSINATIAKLAYEYDLPLWNYWLAVQPLPNHGLDPTDPTGFHLNLDGWNMRSFSALQVLDAVRRATEDLTADGTPLAAASAPAAAPLASFTPGPVSALPFTSLIPASADSAPTSLLLGLSTRAGNELISAGIFQGTLTGQNWFALAETGMTLLDYSDAGILAAQAGNLYLIKDSVRTLLTDQLKSDSTRSAVWFSNERVAAILRTETGDQVVLLDPSGGSLQILPAVPHSPLTLYPSRDPNHIYWGAGDCNETDCSVQEILMTTPDRLSTQTLSYIGQPAFAVDGKMAFMDRDANGQNRLTLVNGEQTQTLPLFGNRLVDMSWSPDGSTLAVSVANVSDYSGLVLQSRLYFVTWPYSTDEVVNLANESIEGHIWSADGKSILMITRKIENAKYHLNFSVLDAATQTQIPALGFQLVSEKYLLLQPIFWTP
jgi:hypothetical protein